MDNGYKEEIAKLLKATDDIEFQIRSLRYKNEELTKENNDDIEELQTQLEQVEFNLKDTLTKSGEDAIKPKCGWVHFRIMKDKIIYTDKTIPEIEIKYPGVKDNYIKITKSLKLNPLKKDLESGEISLDNYSKEIQDKKFEYKFTLHNNSNLSNVS